MANTSQLKNVLQGYVGDITNALTQARAQIALDNYIAAEDAYANLTAGAANSYSDARGTVTKRTVDDARENKDRLWGEFVTLCAQGGVTVPTVADGCGYWDLS